MRLILQDGDSKKAVRLTGPSLTFGSAPSCQVTLSADGVAPKHLRLDIDGQQVTLVPLDGAVTVNGAPVKGEQGLEHGALIGMGGARMKLDLREAAEAPKAAAAAPAAARASRARSGAAAPEASQRVQRSTSRRPQKSFPTWLILLLAIPALALAWVAFRNVAGSTQGEGFAETTSKLRIEDALAQGDLKTARVELEKVDRNMESLSDEWKAVFADLRAKTKEVVAVSEAGISDGRSQAVKDKLSNFKDRYLKQNGRPESREFIRRVDQFLKDFPASSEADWARRMREHYVTYAELDSPDTWADLHFQLRHLTEGLPRDYITAKKLIETFKANNEAPQEMVEFERGLKDSELEFADKDLDQAEGLWERKEYSRSLGAVMGVLTAASEPEVVDRCMKIIRGMGDAAIPAFKGYEERQSDYLDLAARHQDFAGYLKANGIR